MYQMRRIEEGSGSSFVFEKCRFEERRVGREPGRVASSMEWWWSVVGYLPRASGLETSVEVWGFGSDGSGLVALLLAKMPLGTFRGESRRAVGALGWLIAFWPVMIVPSSSAAEM